MKLLAALVIVIGLSFLGWYLLIGEDRPTIVDPDIDVQVQLGQVGRNASSDIPSNVRPVIIGDLSGSMRGYLTKTGANRMASLYQLLLRNIMNAELKALSTEIVPVPGNQAVYFTSSKHYKGNTNLVAGLQQVHTNGVPAVLVTDGMQSEGMYLGMKTELEKMVTDGWGIWLFAIDMPFYGTIDSEQAVDLVTLQSEIQSCVQKHDPNATVEMNKDANRFYKYSGNRPLLIFVLANLVDFGWKISQDIYSNLQADSQFGQDVKAVELAPLYRRGVDILEPERVDKADYLRVDNFSTGSVAIRSDTADGKRIKEVRIPIVWASEPPSIMQASNELPKYDVINDAWLDEEPQIEDTQGHQDQSRVIANVRMKVISDSQNTNVMIFKAWADYEIPESNWWKELSANTSWQCPNKVYKLDELISGVATKAVERHKKNDPSKILKFRLVVGPL
jgi:hypothetical protein